MRDEQTTRALERIANALERLSPAVQDAPALESGSAFHWNGQQLVAVDNFEPIGLDLLTAIERQKEKLWVNSERFADGFAAHDVLLWGSRGMGKSALSKSVIRALQQKDKNIVLVEVGADQLASLPDLFAKLQKIDRAFVLFIDDIGFDEGKAAPRILRSVLEGGAASRPENIRLYVTSNRRHILPRHMSEQEDPINPRDVIDDKLALSDRFGLRLGFHAASQEDYLAMIARYGEVHGLDYDPQEALTWAKQRGHRSGRVAWQFIVELAGRAGKKLS